MMLSRLKEIIITFFILFNSIPCSYSYIGIEKCPGTDVPNIRDQTHFKELSLIFYYTQWSDESLDALEQFNDVAEYYGDKIYFAAIDCWHLACNCSKTVTTSVGSGSPSRWPTLIVHYGRQGQLKIQYNGLFTFRDMIQFVGHVMQPLKRVEKRENLEKIKSTDVFVLGVFKEPNDLEYKNYLIAALKWLEHDPVRTYRFTVTFASFKDNFNNTVAKVPNLLLFGLKNNKSFVDYSDFNWNSTNILRWLHEELNDDYSLLHGYVTPITISQKMKKKPVLAILVNQPQHFFAYMEKYVDKQQPFTKSLLACKKSLKRKVVKINWKKELNLSKVIQNLQIFSDSSKCHIYNIDIVFKNLNFYYEINQHFNQVYQKLNNPKIFDAYYSLILETKELQKFLQSAACLQKSEISNQLPLHISVVKRLEDYITNEQHFKGSNRSLAVVLLDAQRYRDYLVNDMPPIQQNMANVFIVDNKKENMYVMKDRFAMYNLMEFVKNFYSNSLENYYKNKKNISTTSSFRDYDIELKRLNRLEFLDYLQYIHNQTLIVLIYSPDCALCGNIQHSFMQLSLSLRHIVNLKFIRINILDNDLPWQYNMPFLPALLIFPENRFFESRLFPIHLKPDIRNIFGFILSQLPAHQQVNLVLAMCQSKTLSKAHTQSCWQFAKTILMQHIGKHLQYWKMFEAERTLIVERLRAFKDISLDIRRYLRL